MKKMKKAFILFVSGVLALTCVAMSACGKKNNEENQSETQGNNTQTSIPDEVGGEFPDDWD
jgi:ABC-type Fe3+-citrate transport system substrate-binding protein